MGDILKQNRTTITTLEIAEMMEIPHYKVLRKLDGRKENGKHINGYVEILGKSHLGVTDYFIKSSYKTEQNKEMPCYLVTKLGCDFLANKFTGEKGILFTAKYVKRFDEMEQELKNQYKLPTTYKEALVQLLEKVEENEKILASSREVARNFGKRNPDVNRAIENLIVQNCTVKNMFIKTSYISSRGRTENEFLIGRLLQRLKKNMEQINILPQSQKQRKYC